MSRLRDAWLVLIGRAHIFRPGPLFSAHSDDRFQIDYQDGAFIYSSRTTGV